MTLSSQQWCNGLGNQLWTLILLRGDGLKLKQKLWIFFLKALQDVSGWSRIMLITCGLLCFCQLI